MVSKTLIIIMCIIAIFSPVGAKSIADYNCTIEEQNNALRSYSSFVYGFDDGLNNHTVLWYSDENYKAGYRLGSAHRR